MRPEPGRVRRPRSHRVGAALVAAGLATVPWLTTTAPPASAAPPALCATPGRDGTATLAGVVDSYYPGSGTATAGTTAISVGARRGATTPIAAGDLLLVIQMQGASIDADNNPSYGDGVNGGPASGVTNLNSTGRFEYVVATSAVSSGSVNVAGAGTGGGLLNTYTTASATGTAGQRTFQVIRVPQYAGAVLGSGLTAAPWDGASGGVVAVDVAGRLDTNAGSVMASGLGFRGAGGVQLDGSDSANDDDYRSPTTRAAHGGKGEGIAGTPRFVFDPTTGAVRDLTTDGYPNGSRARGAPGQAGGGGTDANPVSNDQNSGGGGGANAGAGGRGGNSWSSNEPVGGHGGAAVAAGADRVLAGGGGGAGTRNDDGTVPLASSGAAGGGIVMIRTGTASGAPATISANGSDAFNDTLNDGGGGGGAGGSVLLTGTGPISATAVAANGGRGGDSWHNEPFGANGANQHGPGGGGGGGAVLTSQSGLGATVTPGGHGVATAGLAAFNATDGSPGTTAMVTPTAIPGAGSGAECSADPSIVVTGPASAAPAGTTTYTITAANYGGVDANAPSWSAATPAGTTFRSLTAPPGWSCATPAVGATGTITCTRSTLTSGSSAVFTLVEDVVALSGTVTLTATITSAPPPVDVDPTNNTSTTTATVINLGAPLADPLVGGITATFIVLVGGGWWLRRRRTPQGPTGKTGSVA
jgi:uncharacterized repeat protein (TIGR01451 family)